MFYFFIGMVIYDHVSPVFFFAFLTVGSGGLQAEISFSFPYGNVSSSQNRMTFDSLNNGFYFTNGNVGINEVSPA